MGFGLAQDDGSLITPRVSAETCGCDDGFPPDDIDSGP